MIIIKAGTPVKVKHPARGMFAGNFAIDFEVNSRGTAIIETTTTVKTVNDEEEVIDFVPCVVRECELIIGEEETK